MSSNRLEEVYKAFTSYDRLVYFHNSQTIIDDKGNALERPPLSKNLVGGSPVIVNISKLQELAKRYEVGAADLLLRLRAKAYFNSSSQVVKRSALEANAHLLKEAPIGIDVFIFASSLRAGGLMYFTDERLTLYRVHGESLSSYAENWSSYAHMTRSGSNEIYLRRAKILLDYIKVYELISSRLLDDINVYLCAEKLNKGSLLLLPLPELGVLPPELRLSLSDVKLALRCYKAGAEGLVDVIFVMGNALLSPLLASPRGRLVIDKLLEGVIKALATKRALKRKA